MAAPTKLCPSCQKPSHVRTRKCTCGHEFAFKSASAKAAGKISKRVNQKGEVRGPVDQSPLNTPRGMTSDFGGDIVAPTGPCPVDLLWPDLQAWFARLRKVVVGRTISYCAVRLWARSELDRQLYELKGAILAQYQKGE